jgi:uncharacterized delta-60 repeat protein
MRGIGRAVMLAKRGPPRPRDRLKRKELGPTLTLMTRIWALIATMLVTLAASLLVTAAAQAAPGDLDPTFSGDGRELTNIGVSDYGRDIAIQADGKIVLVGGSYAGVGGGHNFALARYDPDGSLDTSFSDDGTQTTDFGGNDAASDVAIQPDGKILTVGYGPGDFALARYNPDGSLDSSFSGDGTQTTDFGGGAAFRGAAYGVALQPDGKIVTVGFAPVGADPGDFALARYNPDGSLDSSFSGDGTQTTDFGGTVDGANGVAIQADGKIVAVGRAAQIDGEGAFVLARYNPDGSLDSSFSGDGRQTTDAGGDDAASDVAIQPDGRIVAVGSSYSFVAASTVFVVARYNADGSPDPSFGRFGGLEVIGFGGTDQGYGVALQPDGKIVAAGDASGDFGLARYNGDGSLDASFSGDGMLTTDFGGSDGAYDAAEGVALQPDGKIVAVGGASGDFALARYEGGSGGSEPGTAPATSSPPTISGTATEGQTLTVNPGTWSGSTPISLAYQWWRCDSSGANCADIAGATTTTHTLIAADVGRTIRVRELATNAYGQGSVDSAATVVVKPRPGTIAGTVRRTNGALAGASVNCGSGYSATTAGDGTYSIANVAPASYSCTASANGYRPSTQTVTVTSGQTTLANFKLRR